MMVQMLELLELFNFIRTNRICKFTISAGITTVGIDTNQFNVNNLDVSGISGHFQEPQVQLNLDSKNNGSITKWY